MCEKCILQIETNDVHIVIASLIVYIIQDWDDIFHTCYVYIYICVIDLSGIFSLMSNFVLTFDVYTVNVILARMCVLVCQRNCIHISNTRSEMEPFFIFFLFNVKCGPCLKRDSRNNLPTIYMYTSY